MFTLEIGSIFYLNNLTHPLLLDTIREFNRAATIHRCTGEPRYFLSRYEYRYLNGISLYCKT